MKHLYFILLILTPFSSFSQQSSIDTLHWREDYKLKWDDFKAAPDTNSIGGAGTVSGLTTFSQYTSDTTIEIIIKAVFYKNKSWVKEGWQTDYALNHEQGHFNITEVFARKATIELKLHTNISFLTSGFIKTLIEKSFEDMLKMSAQYDKETTYPIRPDKQKEWDKKIAKWLKETSAK